MRNPLIPEGMGGAGLRVLVHLLAVPQGDDQQWPQWRPGLLPLSLAPLPFPSAFKTWSPSSTTRQLAKKLVLSGTRELGAEARYWLSKRNMKGWSMVWPKRKARVKTLATRGSTLEQYPL